MEHQSKLGGVSGVAKARQQAQAKVRGAVAQLEAAYQHQPSPSPSKQEEPREECQSSSRMGERHLRERIAELEAQLSIMRQSSSSPHAHTAQQALLHEGVRHRVR